MDDKLEKFNRIILSYFEAEETSFWKTINEISSSTKIEPNLVAKVLTTSGDFVRSSYRLKEGEPLYTTRDLFRSKAPFVDKVIGSFKNRID